MLDLGSSKREMPFIGEELGLASGNASCVMASEVCMHDKILLAVPKPYLTLDVLQFEAPGIRVDQQVPAEPLGAPVQSLVECSCESPEDFRIVQGLVVRFGCPFLEYFAEFVWMPADHFADNVCRWSYDKRKMFRRGEPEPLETAEPGFQFRDVHRAESADNPDGYQARWNFPGACGGVGCSSGKADYMKFAEAEMFSEFGNVVGPIYQSSSRLGSRKSIARPVYTDESEIIMECCLVGEFGLEPGSGVAMEIKYRSAVRLPVFGITEIPAVPELEDA